MTALLERDGELAALGGLLDAAGSGEGRFAVVSGPAGIGKTGLLEELRDTAAARGYKVLHARGGELERDFGFGVVRQLFEPLLAGADDALRDELLSGAAGLAEGVLSGRADGPVAGDAGHQALHGLYWLLVNLSESAPVLVAVDDLQWVDAPSLRFVHHLVRRLDGVSIAVVGCCRTGETLPRSEQELLDALLQEGSLLRPAPLSGDAVADLVRTRLGDGGAPQLYEACREGSGGNPFLLGELLRELADGGRRAEDLDPARIRELGPGSIAAAVLLRVGRLGSGARCLTRAISVLGDASTPAALAHVVDDEAAWASDMADNLERLGVLAPGRPLRFAHPVVRSAIYSDIPAGERERLHRRAAEALAADSEQAAAHLLATEPSGDQDTVETLREAGRAAVARGATDSALVYLRRALAEPPADAIRPDVLGELALLAHLDGNSDELALLREAFETATSPPARTALGAVLGHRLFDAERRPQEAVEVFESTLDGPTDPSARSIVEAQLLVIAVSTPAGRARVVGRLAEARERVEALSDDEARFLLVPVAIDLAVSDGTASDVARLASRALGEGELPALCAATGMPFAHQVAVALIWAGELDLAEATLTDVLDRFGERGWVVPTAAAAGFRGWARYLRGDLAAAEADARRCIEEPALAAWGIPNSTAGAALAGVLIEQGRLDEARAVVDAIEEAGYDREALTTYPFRLARAQLLSAEGDPAAALAELELCERFEREADLRVGVSPVSWRSQAALDHLALGDAETAARLAEEELALARRFGHARATGVALRVRALIDDADPDGLAEAVDVLAGSAARLEHARALVDLGASLRRRGGRTESREPLAEGADLAHRCGAEALVERAREELRLAGARPRRIARAGRDGLTPAELRVAELAGNGRTNKQIAQALFVTQRTVEMHLSSSYRKLAIESREELPAALAS